MEKIVLRVAVLLAALAASPAYAAGGAHVPEASSATLFALGVLGVLIGRRGAMRPKNRQGDSDAK